MKSILLALTLAFLGGILPAAALAQVPGETGQQTRVVAGRVDGSLTRREARHLRRQERRIDRRERRATRDGVVTPREARRIERARARHSLAIYRARHNARSR